MDIFSLRADLVEDYKSFTASFVQPRDDRIRAFLDERLASAAQWPDPWLSLNPSFATGGTPAELISEGLLHPGCERIFRVKEVDGVHRADRGPDPPGGSFRRLGGEGHRGVPDERAGEQPGRGAAEVLAFRLLAERAAGDVRARYTGQEKPDERRRILADPPDILLTNYVMPDLVLTRRTSGSTWCTRPGVCAFWCWTNCTPTGAAKAATWPCWCAGFAMCVSRRTCRSSGLRRPWRHEVTP